MIRTIIFILLFFTEVTTANADNPNEESDEVHHLLCDLTFSAKSRDGKTETSRSAASVTVKRYFLQGYSDTKSRYVRSITIEAPDIATKIFLNSLPLQCNIGTADKPIRTCKQSIRKDLSDDLTWTVTEELQGFNSFILQRRVSIDRKTGMLNYSRLATGSDGEPKAIFSESQSVVGSCRSSVGTRLF